jgi:hypothetical protein
MPSVRNFNYVDVPSTSVVVQSTVRPLELRQYYPPWTKEYGNRPELGFVYPSPVIPVTVIQKAGRLVMQSTIFRTDNIFNTNKFNTPVAVANNNPTKLFTTGTVVQPVPASSGYGSGTISDVTASVNSYGANVWTFNLSNLSTTRSLSNGKVITSAPGTGRFSSTVVVDSIVSSTSISCIASGTTAPVNGIVRTVQDSGRLFELGISSVTPVSATEWSLTISGIFDSSVFLFGDEISVVTGSGNLGSLGTGNTVYVTGLPNTNQITCTAINGSAAPTVGKISSLSKTGVNIPFTPAGEIEYTTPGTYTWTVPAGITSVSAVAVGGGGGGGSTWSSGGGGGGGLGWKNNIAVTPGQTYTITVGAGGPSLSNATNAGSEGGNSFFMSITTVAGYGGGRGGPGSNAAVNGRGGGFVGDGGGRGGDGGWDGNWFKGGAGAGGYSGNGADSGNSTGTAAPAGSGAGAAAGYYSSTYGVPAGGGVGIYGRGADGAARGQFFGGGGGSGGTNGTGGEGSGESGFKTISGGRYGGGGGGSGTSYGGGPGGSGAVRIVWGPNKAFPTTNVFSAGSQSQAVSSSVWYDSTIVSVPSLSTTPIVSKQLFRQNVIPANRTVITDSTIGPTNSPARIFNSITTVNKNIVVSNSARTTTTGTSSRIPILGTNNGVNYSDTVTNNSVTARATVDRFPNTGDFSLVGPYQNSFSTYFDGNGDYLQINGNFVMNFGSADFTIEAWVYLNAMPTADAWPSSYSSHMVVITAGSVNAADGIGLLIGSSRIAIQNNDTAYWSTAHGMTTGVWYHIAVLRISNTLYYYVNGVPKGRNAFSGSVGTGANTFIGSETGQGAFLNGYISNLRVVKGPGLPTDVLLGPGGQGGEGGFANTNGSPALYFGAGGGGGGGLEPPVLYDFTAATFTSGGVSGSTGPSLTSARNGLTGTGVDTWKNNTAFFNTTNGIQYWVVPKSGTYRIEAWGAQGGGGGYGGGFGARISGEFTLSMGETIRILVGQQGGTSYGGGGGGTFVVRTPFNTNAAILAIAGGGNTASPWSSTLRHAVVTTSGASSSAYAGGTDGNGGNSNAGVYGGAGFLTNAQGSDSCSATRPQAFVNGGTGGVSCNSIGGFGGGSATDGCCYGASGAGGGYSGGGGTSSSSQYGGAGGSYNSGANQSNNEGNTGTANLAGNGRVIITLI